MARLATSLFICLVASIALAQPFGRFGYSGPLTLPGLVADREGVAAKFGAADKLYFASPTTDWKILSTTDVEQIISLGSGAGPDKLRASLYSPGVMLHFAQPLALKLHSTAAPYLSWREGSVGDNVPTPNLRWVGLSFQDEQPPLVLGFMDAEASLQLTGRPGDWTLRTAKPYLGWVRVAAPLGTRPLATNSAAALGQLSVSLAAADHLWWQPTPTLLATQIDSNNDAVEATWVFDRAGVVVPAGAALANLGEYPLSIESKTHRLDGYSEEGPITVCDNDRLTIRFPIHRIPLGRVLTAGLPQYQPIGTVSSIDFASVSDLAFENLLASRDLQQRKLAEDTLNNFLGEAQYSLEPQTRQRLPFAEDGTGVDAAAANALLYQSFIISTRPSSHDNSLLTSVGWRRDWYSWRIWAADQKRSRRAGALCAIAGALCPEPTRRLDAAMLQAGLAAERGLGVYLARQAQAEVPMYLEPLWTVRNTIFEMAQTPRRTSAFAVALLSGVRVFGDAPVRCSTDGSKSSVQWVLAESKAVTLASSFPISAAGAQHALGFTRLFPTGNAASQTVAIQLPYWAQPLPASLSPPQYDEPVN